MIEGGRRYKGARFLLSETYDADPDEHVSRRFDSLFALHIPWFKTCGLQPDYAHRETGPRIIIHPGAKWPPRRWPRERYLELARALASDGSAVCLVVHHRESDLRDFFAGNIRGDAIEVREVNDVRNLIDIIDTCLLFIGNDSGPAQLANLLSKPSVVLWGPGNLDRIGPRGSNSTVIMKRIECRPCRQYIHRSRCERGENLCLLTITVADVVQAVREKLKTPHTEGNT
jgi:ADP-heptose:LPS heptosyltransferase